jgi:hypothetical protein
MLTYYMVSMWALVGSFFMAFSDSYKLGSHNKACVAFRESLMRHMQESDRKSDLRCGYGHGMCVFVDFLTWVTFVLPDVFIVKCGVVNKLWGCSPISFKHVSLWCLFFAPDLIIHVSRI